ncbi:sulfur carrier protein ThiS [Clostridium sp. B9]|uniref:sulfur carrier protein ThiS n=1 Tax=Clostridium sp. B9 TaxID=3423224 RepID=UPI003D2EB06D
MKVNGKQMDKKDLKTISDLLEKLNVNKNRVVVELNREIIKVEDFDEILLNHEDSIEIIAFVGGG